MIIRRLALGLAEWTDLLARHITGDDCADQLNAVEVDRGDIASVVHLDPVRGAMLRHPAKGRKA